MEASAAIALDSEPLAWLGLALIILIIFRKSVGPFVFHVPRVVIGIVLIIVFSLLPERREK